VVPQAHDRQGPVRRWKAGEGATIGRRRAGGGLRNPRAGSRAGSRVCLGRRRDLSTWVPSGGGAKQTTAKRVVGGVEAATGRAAQRNGRCSAVRGRAGSFILYQKAALALGEWGVREGRARATGRDGAIAMASGEAILITQLHTLAVAVAVVVFSATYSVHTGQSLQRDLARCRARTI
jgi:hypothetical protein